MRHRSIILSFPALLVLATPALAQQASGDSNAVTKQQSLNEEQARLAKAQLDQNAANQATYEQQLRDYRAQLAQAQQQPSDGSAQQLYQQQLAQLRQQQADVAAQQARVEREHERAMARWKAEVAACKAGDERHCAAH